MIEMIANTGKPIILSAGLTDLNEIKKTQTYIQEIWNKKGINQEMSILHCVVSYPTQPHEANLLAIQELKNLNVVVGYSDHTLGIDAAVLSVALGARIIEKHFTIDKQFSEFRDHQLSADPQDFKLLTQNVKNSIELLGMPVKFVQPSEKEMLLPVRRSIVASCDLEEGTNLKWEHLTWVRPGNGLSPGKETEVLGKTLMKSVRRGDMILPHILRS